MNTINIKKEIRLKFESDALFDVFNLKKSYLFRIVERQYF